MSQPPEFPGSRRLKRAAKNTGGSAYEGAFEAVGAILIATLLGYWFDEHFETTPTGVITGAAIGFGAFVLRLLRMGRQFHPDDGTAETEHVSAAGPGPEREDGSDEQDERDEDGAGIGLGLSEVLRPDDDEHRKR